MIHRDIPLHTNTHLEMDVPKDVHGNLLRAIIHGMSHEVITHLLVSGADPFHVCIPAYDEKYRDKNGNYLYVGRRKDITREASRIVGDCALKQAVLRMNFDLFKLLLLFDGKRYKDRTVKQKLTLCSILPNIIVHSKFATEDDMQFLLEYDIRPEVRAETFFAYCDDDDFETLLLKGKCQTSWSRGIFSSDCGDSFYTIYHMISFGRHLMNRYNCRLISELMFKNKEFRHARYTFTRENYPRGFSMDSVKFPVHYWTPEVHSLELLNEQPNLGLKKIREVLLCLHRSHPEVHWDVQNLLFEFIWGSMFNVFF